MVRRSFCSPFCNRSMRFLCFLIFANHFLRSHTCSNVFIRVLFIRFLCLATCLCMLSFFFNIYIYIYIYGGYSFCLFSYVFLMFSCFCYAFLSRSKSVRSFPAFFYVFVRVLFCGTPSYYDLDVSSISQFLSPLIFLSSF